MLIKNRDIPGGKEFWDHVEKIAALVRSNTEVYGNFRMEEPMNHPNLTPEVNRAIAKSETVTRLEDTRLEEIAQERSSLEEKLDVLATEERALLMKKHGIKIGMKVQDEKGKIYSVTGVSNWWYSGQPWLYGNLQKKDGSFGAGRTIYTPWKVVE